MSLETPRPVKRQREDGRKQTGLHARFQDSVHAQRANLLGGCIPKRYRFKPVAPLPAPKRRCFTQAFQARNLLLAQTQRLQTLRALKEAAKEYLRSSQPAPPAEPSAAPSDPAAHADASAASVAAPTESEPAAAPEPAEERAADENEDDSDNDGDADEDDEAEQLQVLEARLKEQQAQKHGLFLQLKAVLHEEQRKKQLEQQQEKRAMEEKRLAAAQQQNRQREDPNPSRGPSTPSASALGGATAGAATKPAVSVKADGPSQPGLDSPRAKLHARPAPSSPPPQIRTATFRSAPPPDSKGSFGSQGAGASSGSGSAASRMYMMTRPQSRPLDAADEEVDMEGVQGPMFPARGPASEMRRDDRDRERDWESRDRDRDRDRPRERRDRWGEGAPEAEGAEEGEEREDSRGDSRGDGRRMSRWSSQPSGASPPLSSRSAQRSGAPTRFGPPSSASPSYPAPSSGPAASSGLSSPPTRPYQSREPYRGSRGRAGPGSFSTHYPPAISLQGSAPPLLPAAGSVPLFDPFGFPGAGAAASQPSSSFDPARHPSFYPYPPPGRQMGLLPMPHFGHPVDPRQSGEFRDMREFRGDGRYGPASGPSRDSRNYPSSQNFPSNYDYRRR